MNGIHIHLLLNHVPVIGLIVTLVVLAWGIWRRSDDIVRLGLTMLVVLGVTAVVVYLSGEPAEEAVEGLAGVSESLIERHEEAALFATMALTATAALALAVMIRFRRRPLPLQMARGLLLVALVSAGVMGWTANLGGQIRHTEIRGEVASAPSMADRLDGELTAHESTPGGSDADDE